MEKNVDIVTLLCALLLPILILCLLMVYFRVIRPFWETRRYIKMEMLRTDGEEYNFWKHELKMLYIELIPVFGWFIKKYKR